MSLVDTPYKMVKSDMVSLTSFIQSAAMLAPTNIDTSGRQEQVGNRFSEPHWKQPRKTQRKKSSQSGRLLPCTREAQIRFVVSHSFGPLCHSFLSQTVSATMTFFLAMSLYPEVQAKAQSEIDQIIGTNRLPGFEDRNSLPYLNALIKEVLRWNPVVTVRLGIEFMVALHSLTMIQIPRCATSIDREPSGSRTKYT
jgi:hypothetical protein